MLELFRCTSDKFNGSGVLKVAIDSRFNFVSRRGFLLFKLYVIICMQGKQKFDNYR